MIPDATKTYDLGSSTKYFRDAYLRKLFLSTATNEGLASHILPVAKSLYDLGSLTRYMRTVNFNRIRVMDIVNDTHYWTLTSGEAPNHAPDVFAFDFWDGSYLWTIFQFDAAIFSFQTVDTKPMDDDVYNLGDETTPLRWANLFLSRYLKLGNVASLPTPDASYRGKMIRVEGGTGVKDILYLCKKKADDTYAWLKLLDELDGGGGGGVPSDTVVSETSFGQSPSAGTATTYSRGDHTHGTPTDPIPAHNVATGVHGIGSQYLAKTTRSDQLIDHTNIQNVLADQHHAQLHKDAHKSGGGDAFVSTDLLEAVVKRLRESAGPTDLTLGAVADNQYLKRSGTTIIGETPSGAGPRQSGTVSVDPPSIAKTTTTNVDVTVSGLLTSDKIVVQCQSDLEHGLVCTAAYVPSANTLRLRITNWSSAAVDGAARTWWYTAWA